MRTIAHGAARKRIVRNFFLGFGLVVLVALIETFALFGPRWLTAATILVVAVIQGFLAWREFKLADGELQAAEEQAEAEWQTAIRGALLHWELQRARAMQAVPGGVDAESPEARASGYIDRDIESAVLKELRRSGRALIVGTPWSGVSRTAFELLRRSAPDALVVAPRPPDGFELAFNQLRLLDRVGSQEKPPPIALWLDDIDKFSGLTARALFDLEQRCKELRTVLRIVATVSTNRLDEWSSRNQGLSDMFAVELPSLRRRLSIAELSAAQSVHPESDFSHGIPAAFSGSRRLLTKLAAGNSSCPYEPNDDCELSQDLVAAVAGWAGTGTPRTLSRPQLRELVGERLSLTPDNDADQHFEQAFRWSSSQGIDGQSILKVTEEGGISIHSKVAELLIDRHPPDSATWNIVVQDAASDGDWAALDEIGYRALIVGSNVVAAGAWAKVAANSQETTWMGKAADLKLPNGAEVLAWIRLHEQHRQSCGKSDAREAVLTLGMGFGWRNGGHYKTARPLFEKALGLFESLGAPGHILEIKETMLGLVSIEMSYSTPPADWLVEKLRTHIALWEARYGRKDVGAATLYQSLARIHRFRNEIAVAEIAAMEALEIVRTQTRISDADAADVYNEMAVLLAMKRDTESIRAAIDLFESAAAIATREGGRVQQGTTILGNLSDAYRLAGRADESRLSAEDALDRAIRRYGAESAITLPLRRTYARSLAGDARMAKAQINKALAISLREFGENSVECALVHEQRAVIYWLDRDYATALNEYEASYPILSKHYHANGRALAHLQISYGYVCLSENFTERGIALYKASIESDSSAACSDCTLFEERRRVLDSISESADLPLPTLTEGRPPQRFHPLPLDSHNF